MEKKLFTTNINAFVVKKQSYLILNTTFAENLFT